MANGENGNPVTSEFSISIAELKEHPEARSKYEKYIVERTKFRQFREDLMRQKDALKEALADLLASRDLVPHNILRWKLDDHPDKEVQDLWVRVHAKPLTRGRKRPEIKRVSLPRPEDTTVVQEDTWINAYKEEHPGVSNEDAARAYQQHMQLQQQLETGVPAKRRSSGLHSGQRKDVA